MRSKQADLRFDSVEAASRFYASLAGKGCEQVAGLDECGRGPYAGPVVAACVLLPLGHSIEGISDSKRICARRRRELSAQIREVGVWGIGVRESHVIDEVNILVATLQAATTAAMQCIYSGAPVDYLLCDGGLRLQDRVPVPTASVIKGDLWFECIGAASIVAKVYRDELMSFYHDSWPEYGFDTNQGYGTKKHVEAIKNYGITPIHRRSFGICKDAPDIKYDTRG